MKVKKRPPNEEKYRSWGVAFPKVTEINNFLKARCFLRTWLALGL